VRLFAGRENGEAYVAVVDEGPGIPRSEQEKIFQRFYQVDRSRSKTRPGTGLGLAIVKHLVQLHGGRVEVESEAGRGSTFRVRIPLA
jgi:signal transduction histidine kinase